MKGANTVPDNNLVFAPLNDSQLNQIKQAEQQINQTNQIASGEVILLAYQKPQG